MGTSSVSVDVSIFNDTMYEGREYFQCTIFTDETTGITPGREHTATVDILDDDCELLHTAICVYVKLYI